jgi:hypothetical protein
MFFKRFIVIWVGFSWTVPASSDQLGVQPATPIEGKPDNCCSIWGGGHFFCPRRTRLSLCSKLNLDSSEKITTKLLTCKADVTRTSGYAGSLVGKDELGALH